MEEETNDVTNKGPWPKWLPRYKDLIEIVVWIIGIGFGLFTLVSIKDQVDALKLQGNALSEQTSALNQEVKALSDLTGAMRSHIDAVTEQTRAIFEQNRVLDEQVKASEFENRAILSIDAFKPTDITSNTGAVSARTGQAAASDTSQRFSVHFTLRNQGKATATLDTILYELFDSRQESTKGSEFRDSKLLGIPLSTSKSLIEVLPFAVSKSGTYIFRIELKYRWVTSSGDTKTDSLKKYGHVNYEDGAWHFNMVTPSQFDGLKSQIQERK